MYYYKTKIQYEGTNFAGFQWQNGVATVQSEFNLALSKLVSGKIATMAASRTNSGVHAIEQIVKISSENNIDCTTFLKLFNKTLVPQVRALEIAPCAGLFRPASDNISKEYRYFFTNKIITSKSERQFTANISNKLDLEAMIFCIRALEGVHDFTNFCSAGSNVKSTIRNISCCEFSQINPHEIFDHFELFKIPNEINNCYQLKFIANGFLKHMIRHIVSALWMVGSKKISTDEFLNLLNGKKVEKQLWKLASPNGLFLYKINYT